MAAIAEVMTQRTIEHYVPIADAGSPSSTPTNSAVVVPGKGVGCFLFSGILFTSHHKAMPIRVWPFSNGDCASLRRDKEISHAKYVDTIDPYEKK